MKNILAQRKIKQKTTGDNEISFFSGGGGGSNIFTKIFTANPNVLAFPISLLTSPLLFFLFVFLLVCFESSIRFLGAGRTHH